MGTWSDSVDQLLNISDSKYRTIIRMLPLSRVCDVGFQGDVGKAARMYLGPERQKVDSRGGFPREREIMRMSDHHV